MKKIFIKKKEILSEDELIKKRRETTAQQWIPIADIDNNIIYRKDNLLVGILKVKPKNLELLSDNEKNTIINSVTEGYNGEIENFQIFCIGRPVDLNNYLEWLQVMAREEQNFIKKSVLKGYIKEGSNLASSGETIERQFYIIINKKNGSKAEIELMSRLKEFKDKLSQAELFAEICNDDELMDVLSLFANPIQTAFERTEIRFDLPALVEA